jgi:hypothetical protein
MIFLGFSFDWGFGIARADQCTMMWLGPLRLEVFYDRRP